MSEIEMKSGNGGNCEGEAIRVCETCKHKHRKPFEQPCGYCYEDLQRWEPKQQSRPAATPEPMSKPGCDYILPEVIKDLGARDVIGKKKYKTSLQTFNGRDAMNDAYQEALDQVMYLKQAIMERDLSKESLEEKIVKWANDRELYKSSTWETQLSKLHEEIGEWQEEVLSGDKCAEMLEIGDMYVVLVNIAKSRGFSLEHCGWAAYGKIKDRTGKMLNGTFVKDS